MIGARSADATTDRVIDTEIQQWLNFRIISGENGAEEESEAMRQMSIFAQSGRDSRPGQICVCEYSGEYT